MSTTSDVSAFPAGTFTPAPRRASTAAMLLAQGRIESLLFLRHGEQQLINLFIPFVGLIALAKFDLLGSDDPLTVAFPFILSVAAMSSGFTGQAISLAFDRRYGALKRTGASGVPAWTIVFGKVIAVIAVTVVQLLILGTTALLLGWRAPVSGIALGVVTLVIGVAAFTALGLLMGGTLSSELVLALANLIWIVLTAVAAWAVFTPGVDAGGALSVIPSVALAQGMTTALSGHLPLLQLVVLLVWLGVAGFAANRWFSFTPGR
ncbi:ABC transporter permease [Corynebacterium pacaense]|uniref:ABC transporter permease n=1 Tax=Corynebacterium pacaense TaxID=1816684 RepID=UPI0009BBA8F2|nr:ABC transporter permease [Corynebacterium pacaense]